jgi:hypothetical protein
MSDILSKTKNLIVLMKAAGIFGGEPGQWKAVAIQEPKSKDFADVGTIDEFKGTAFRLFGDEASTSDYFEPPSELGLEHDDAYGKEEGFWKKFVPKEIKAVRGLVETGISAPKTSSELKSWDSRKISKYLLGEAENYEALYACIISQLENVPTEEARNAIEQLNALMETTTEPVPRTGKSLDQDDEEEISRAMESLSMKKKKAASPPKPKVKTPSPKVKAKTPSPPKRDLAKLEKLIATYHQKVEAGQPTKAVADAIARLAKELGVTDDELAERDFYGFGRSSLQPNRRRSRRRSAKKTKKMARRTSKAKRKVRTSGQSLKKNKRRTSKHKTKKVSKFKKSFGSTIYGLQGGMQNGPIYKGVYPMTLKVNETLPNLNNVKRTYALNEFGTKKNKRGSVRAGKSRSRSRSQKKTEFPAMDRRGKRTSSKKMSRIATVATVAEDGDGDGDGDDDGGSYGRSFGSCGCGDGDKDEEN